jgi:nucleoside-diphosphate-sugar epimerase
MNNELVVVTGSSGYVAGQCILQLLQQGYRVRGTLRSLERAPESDPGLRRGWAVGHRQKSSVSWQRIWEAITDGKRR